MEEQTQTAQVAKLICHLKEPKNLLVWLVATAWSKYMGLQEYLPTITLG